jgi:hypothetical protein
MTPTTGSTHPPHPRIERDGNRLIAPRGADFSAFCFQCAKASAGQPLTKYLRVDKSSLFHKPTGPGAASSALFVLDILEYLLWLVWWVVDWPKSRRRHIAFGLCAAHRRRRLLLRMAAIAGLPLGAAVLIGGIFADLADPLDFIAVASGVALVGGGMVAAACLPDPALAGENAEFLWLKGAGKAFLDRIPAKRP